MGFPGKRGRLPGGASFAVLIRHPRMYSPVLRLAAHCGCAPSVGLAPLHQAEAGLLRPPSDTEETIKQKLRKLRCQRPQARTVRQPRGTQTYRLPSTSFLLEGGGCLPHQTLLLTVSCQSTEKGPESWFCHWTLASLGLSFSQTQQVSLIPISKGSPPYKCFQSWR